MGTPLMMDNLILIGIAFLALLVIGLIFSRLYRRSSKERAFVRTGLGGQKVVMDGGALVFPVFHETILVNMNTLKLEVMRFGKDSLFTKDRMVSSTLHGLSTWNPISTGSFSAAACSTVLAPASTTIGSRVHALASCACPQTATTTFRSSISPTCSRSPTRPTRTGSTRSVACNRCTRDANSSKASCALT